MTAKTPIKFGTDGWRGIIAEDYTFENVRYCAQGLAEYLEDQGLHFHGVVVGYDTRFESEDFAAAVAEVLAGNGIRAYLTDRANPTPVVSLGILSQKAGAGVMITASHNPARYNGFKVRSAYGGAAAPEVLAELEGRIADAQAQGRIRRVPRRAAESEGLIVLFDPGDAYRRQVGGLVDLEAIRNAGLRVVADAMYGAGAGWLAHLASGRTTVVEIRGERNPIFPGINPEPIPRNLGALFEKVREVGADVGLATDGDADRLGVCDEQGRFVDQLRTYSLLALYLLEVRGWRGPIIKTISTSSMLEKLGRLYNVPVYETGVGFKYVAPKMLEVNAICGGEESGGYAFRGHLPERDSILAGLFFLDLMVKLNRRPSELVEYLFSKVGPHYYDRIDVELEPEARPRIETRLQTSPPAEIGGYRVERLDTTDGYKFYLADGSWVLVRFSGTEPLLRIYGETDDPEKLRRLLAETRDRLGI